MRKGCLVLLQLWLSRVDFLKLDLLYIFEGLLFKSLANSRQKKTICSLSLYFLIITQEKDSAF